MSRNIPWTRVLVEGVVIIVSILLAFGIDAWWDASQENRAVRVHLEALAVEVDAQKLQANGGIARRTERMEVMRSLVATMNEGASPPSGDTLDAWLGALWGAWDPLPPLAALANLHASGTFPAIASDELRLELSRLERAIEQAAGHDARVIHAWENGLRPFLVEHSDALPQIRYRQSFRSLGLDGVEPAFLLDPANLLTQPVFQNLLLTRMNRTAEALRRATELVGTLDKVASLIEQELAR